MAIAPNLKTDFAVVGRGTDTGRVRKRTYRAFSIEESREMAAADKLAVTDVSPVPEPPASENQLNYAFKLELKLPNGITVREASDAISKHLDQDKTPEPQALAMARQCGVEYSSYIGCHRLFGDIDNALTVPGRQKEHLQWFLYTLARDLLMGSQGFAQVSPSHPGLVAIAEQFFTNESVMKSVRAYDGGSLAKFGRAMDGIPYDGGSASRDTIAYKTCMPLVRKALNLQPAATSAAHSTAPALRKATPPKAAKGCFGVMVMCIGGGAGLAWLIQTVI